MDDRLEKSKSNVDGVFSNFAHEVKSVGLSEHPLNAFLQTLEEVRGELFKKKRIGKNDFYGPLHEQIMSAYKVDEISRGQLTILRSLLYEANDWIERMIRGKSVVTTTGALRELLRSKHHGYFNEQGNYKSDYMAEYNPPPFFADVEGIVRGVLDEGLSYDDIESKFAAYKGATGELVNSLERLKDMGVRSSQVLAYLSEGQEKGSRYYAGSRRGIEDVVILLPTVIIMNIRLEEKENPPATREEAEARARAWIQANVGLVSFAALYDRVGLLSGSTGSSGN